MSILGLALAILLTGGVVKDDFLVNPDLPQGGSKAGILGVSSPQGWLAAWTDDRNAANRNDILAQRLAPELSLLGSNYIITSDSAVPQKQLVGLVSDSMGNTLAVWKNGVFGEWFWMRRFTPAGEPLERDSFLFGTEGNFSNIHVAMNAKGEFAMTWLDVDSDYVALQVFNPDGSTKGELQRVTYESTEIDPQVAIASNGAVIVAWSSGNKVFARCYKPLVEPRGDVFEVASFTNNPDNPPRTGGVQVGCDHAGKFIVVWYVGDLYSTVYMTLYFRCFSWSGDAYEPAKEIYDMPNSSRLEGLRMVAGWDGSFSIAWGDNRSGQYRVYLQNFMADGSLRGPEIAVSAENPLACRIESLVLHDDQWLAVYSAVSPQYWNILCRRGMVYGSLIGNEVLLNDDQNSCCEELPRVLVSDSGAFVTLWTEGWSTGPPAYLKRFSKDGAPLSDTIRVSDTSGVNRLTDNHGHASMDKKSGEFVIAWKTQNPDVQIRAQRYTKYGYPKGNEIKVNPEKSMPNYLSVQSDVSMNRKGMFAVTWRNMVNDNMIPIYVRRFDKNDSPVDEVPVLIGTAKNSRSTPSIVLKDDGSFIIAWRDVSTEEIRAQRFSASAKPLADQFMVNDTLYSVERSTPRLAVDKQGNFCVAWSMYGYLYVKFFDPTGKALTKEISTSIFDTSQVPMSILSTYNVAALPDEGFVVYGTDYSTGNSSSDVSAQYFHSDGTVWTRKFSVAQPDPFSINYQVASRNSVAAGGDRIVYVWQDNRRHKGWDIYAKVVDLEVPGVVEPVTPPPPLDFEAVTTVGSTVTLRYTNCPGGFHASVFDASGRRVGEIRSAATTGTAVWGESFGPGVYFIMPDDLKMTPAKIVLVK